MRNRMIEIVCNQCGAVIGHYQKHIAKTNIDWQIKDEGGIIRPYGDFCDQVCLQNYKISRRVDGARKVEP